MSKSNAIRENSVSCLLKGIKQVQSEGAAFVPQQQGDEKFETALKSRVMAGAAKPPRW
ncbi:MAG: hypothetical protein AABZ34_20340 [Nitrospirota bacterium]